LSFVGQICLTGGSCLWLPPHSIIPSDTEEGRWPDTWKRADTLLPHTRTQSIAQLPPARLHSTNAEVTHNWGSPDNKGYRDRSSPTPLVY